MPLAEPGAAHFIRSAPSKTYPGYVRAFDSDQLVAMQSAAPPASGVNLGEVRMPSTKYVRLKLPDVFDLLRIGNSGVTTLGTKS
jgi:hypothetical protein